MVEIQALLSIHVMEAQDSVTNLIVIITVADIIDKRRDRIRAIDSGRRTLAFLLISD